MVLPARFRPGAPSGGSEATERLRRTAEEADTFRFEDQLIVTPLMPRPERISSSASSGMRPSVTT